MNITALGDAIITLPAAALLAIWLSAGRAWRMAFWWCALFGAGLVLVVLSKLAFLGWGVGIPSLDFTGASGHSMRATAVIPALLYVLLQYARPSLRISAIITGLLAGVLVGVSRVMVGAHSVPEVVAGCILGAVVSLSFIRITYSLSRPPLNRPLVVLGLLGLCGTSFANPAPTKLWLKEVAIYLSGREEVFQRSGPTEGSHATTSCAGGASSSAGRSDAC